jgi:hypothetical protein
LREVVDHVFIYKNSNQLERAFSEPRHARKVSTALLVQPSERGTKMEKTVSTVGELLSAAKDNRVESIVVAADFSDVPGFDLLPGQTIHSAPGQQFTLTFADEIDGIQLSSDNSVLYLDLHVSPNRRAIWNDSSVTTLGRIVLGSVNTIGRVQLLAKDNVRGGRVEVSGLAILAADSRAEQARPHEYGVSVIQGVFTLWNMQPDPDVVITADLLNISAGRFGAPVFGSGIFVSGAGDQGGRLNVQHLTTGGVYSDGKLPAGTADQITAGVFTVYGTYVDLVKNDGPVITYGVNDMALDNWGTVERWIAKQKLTTLGPSGIGFVNFGKISDLAVEAPIETFGPGARGFNVYTGTVKRADFDRIITHGNGAVGVQISQPIGELTVRRGIETFGGTGPSLVKGVVQNLSAICLSIKPGGSAKRVSIDGGLKTHSKGIAPLEQQGNVEQLHITGGFGPTEDQANVENGMPD